MRGFRILLLSLFSPLLLAQDLVEFENGKVANADDINANFSTLVDAIQTIETSSGATLLTGENAPDPSLGQVGDIYLDTTDYRLYGPKQVIGWGAGKSLVGPPGDSSGGTGADCSALLCELNGDACENPLALYDALDLADCNLAGEDLSGRSFPLASLTNANLMNADLTGSDLSGSNLESANVRGATAEGMTGSILQAKGVDAENANFASAILAGSNFKGGDFTQATLTGADLAGVNFDRATLAQIEGTGSQLQNASLIATNMESANLAGANLSQSDLTGSSLANASLTGASFEGAVLTGVNLSSANLTSANLVGADIEGVDWTDSVCPSGEVATGACASSAGVCGDGITDPNFGEECDPGNPDDSDICTQACEVFPPNITGFTRIREGNEECADICVFPPTKTQLSFSAFVNPRGAPLTFAGINAGPSQGQPALIGCDVTDQSIADLPNITFQVECDPTDYFTFGASQYRFQLIVEDEFGKEATETYTEVIRVIDTQPPSISDVTLSPDPIVFLASDLSSSQEVTVVANVEDNDPNVQADAFLAGTQITKTGRFNWEFEVTGLDTGSVGMFDLGELLVIASDQFNETEMSIAVTADVIDDIHPNIAGVIVTPPILVNDNSPLTISLQVTVSDNHLLDSINIESDLPFVLDNVEDGMYFWSAEVMPSELSLGVTNFPITISATDTAGNLASFNTNATINVVDESSPFIENVELSSEGRVLANDSLFITNSETTTVMISANILDNLELASVTAISELPVSDLSTELIPGTGNIYEYTGEVTVSGATLPEGQTSYPIQVVATDTSGNTTSVTSYLEVANVDDINPIIEDASLSNNSVSVSYTTATTVTLNASVTDNRGISSVTVVSDLPIQSQSISSDNYSWVLQINGGTLPLGQSVYPITVNALDSAGNSASSQLQVTVTNTDDVPPLIAYASLSLDTVFVTSTTTVSVVLTALVNDNGGISSVTATSDLPIQLQSTSGDVYQWGITVSGATLPEGQNVYPVQIDAIDTSGNLTAITLLLTVNNGPG